MSQEGAPLNTITKLVEPAIYRVTIPGYLLLKHHLALPGRWDVTGGKNKKANAYLTENGVAEAVNLLQRIDLAVKAFAAEIAGRLSQGDAGREVKAGQTAVARPTTKGPVDNQKIRGRTRPDSGRTTLARRGQSHSLSGD